MYITHLPHVGGFCVPFHTQVPYQWPESLRVLDSILAVSWIPSGCDLQPGNNFPRLLSLLLAFSKLLVFLLPDVVEMLSRTTTSY